MTSLPNPDDRLDTILRPIQPTTAQFKKEQIKALIKSEKQALLDCLQAGVPGKLEHPKQYLREHTEMQIAEQEAIITGFNQAVRLINATIEDVRKEL
jgi:hypothetical protein